jgi:hypothetical protein
MSEAMGIFAVCVGKKLLTNATVTAVYIHERDRINQSAACLTIAVSKRRLISLSESTARETSPHQIFGLDQTYCSSRMLVGCMSIIKTHGNTLGTVNALLDEMEKPQVTWSFLMSKRPFLPNSEVLYYFVQFLSARDF